MIQRQIHLQLQAMWEAKAAFCDGEKFPTEATIARLAASMHRAVADHLGRTEAR